MIQIFANLNMYVIGQELAKKTLDVAVYNHGKRIHQNSSTLFNDEFAFQQLFSNWKNPRGK